MLDAVRSIIFAVAFNLGSVVYSALAVLMIPFGRPPVVRVVRAWSRYHRMLARVVLRQPLLIDGRLDNAPVLYVFKHESAFETIDMPGAFDHPAVFAKAELLSIPLWGRAAAFYGLIFVDRDGGAAAMRQMLAAAREAMDDGRPLVLFAEGTRVAPGERPPLKPGFAGLYLQLKVPVIPVAVASGRVYPASGLWKRAGAIRYKVGEPIPPGLPRREAEARVHAAINALND